MDQRLRDAAEAIDGSRETTGDLLRRGEGDAFRREFADDEREERERDHDHATLTASAYGANPGSGRRVSASLLASVAPLKAPASRPTSVMPIWTVGRKRFGASARRSAAAAPVTPVGRHLLKPRFYATETTAISLMAKIPFAAKSASTIRISKTTMLIRSARGVTDRNRGQSSPPPSSAAAGTR